MTQKLIYLLGSFQRLDPIGKELPTSLVPLDLLLLLYVASLLFLPLPSPAFLFFCPCLLRRCIRNRSSDEVV